MKRKQNRSQRSTMPILPYEVVEHIFQYLPLADVRNARRVCREWHEAGTRRPIAQREKFVFPADVRLKCITRFMLQSSYPVLNLEFEDQLIADIHPSVWRECGERIHELVFHRCVVSEDAMKNIILHCKNLTTFDVNSSKGHRKRLPYTLPLLNDLLKRGIRRPKLSTLSIYIEEKEHQEIIRGISQVHPSVRTLKISTAPDSAFTLRLGDCLSPDTPLESLTYDTFTYGDWMETMLTDRAERGFRLKYLKTALLYDARKQDTILRFLRSQKNLEVITIRIFRDSEWLFQHYLFSQIREGCQKLRHLNLEYVDTPGCTNLLSPSQTSRFVRAIHTMGSLTLGSVIYYTLKSSGVCQAASTSLIWDDANFKISLPP